MLIVQIICSHENLDFDGLASMIGTGKLYPEARLILPQKSSRPVREFLAIYKDIFPLERIKDLENAGRIKRLIIVDTNQIQRLGRIGEIIPEDIEISIYDHHPLETPGLQGKPHVVEPVGATSTLIVEKLQEVGQTLIPMEATLLALGIYQDTGSLRYPSTTPRDVQAVAYLLEAGANLGVINTFLDRPLNPQQQRLYNELVNSAGEKWIKGTNVLVSTARTENYVGGLGFVCEKLGDLFNPDVVLAVVSCNKQVDVIARSRVDWVRVNELLQELGGGGHPRAASVKIKNASRELVLEKLSELLQSHIQPPVTAQDLMSKPVKSLSSAQTVQEAARLLQRYGHSGMPVMEEDRLVGIISRRDIDKAIHHRLGHAPVKAYMSRNVKYIDPGAPLSDIRELMIKHDIGRLPVLEKGALVGIVTRTDVLRILHEGYACRLQITPGEIKCPTTINVEQILRKSLDAQLISIFQQIGNIAGHMGQKVFLVGGFVRDLLIGHPNHDIDLVVEGNALELAEILAVELGGQYRTHKPFRTAVLWLPGGFKLDLATARSEFYAYPAALPSIESARLKEDLYRRDFTVNAMAISLDPENFGTLLDLFCGFQDLQKGIIRILHNLSFVEDPTRAIRAFRFAATYGWKIEGETKNLLLRALEDRRLEEVSPFRLWQELKLICQEENPVTAFRLLQETGAGQQIVPGGKWDDQLILLLDQSHRWIKALDALAGIHPWRVYLSLILRDSPLEHREKTSQQFGLHRLDRVFLQEVREARLEFPYRIDDLFSPGKWHRYFQSKSVDTVIAYAVLSAQQEVLAQASTYLQLRQKRQLAISGQDLLDLGLAEGPAIGKILEEIQ
ncbi:MAG TPA: CBS domain-containing protein, partial [Clostridia bacterium]|nr:CBS domain-containing protein [Clostridia bacterium]